MDANMTRPTLTHVALGLREEKATAKGEKPWKHYAFRCTLTLGRESMDFDYRMGTGCKGKPELSDVLGSLFGDAGSYDNARSFEDWCSDYSMDPDSRTAERMYRACADTARDLRRVLGSNLYAALASMDEDALREWCAPTPSPAPEGVRS